MYQPSANPNDPSGSESDRIRALLENLNNLRAKLKNFAVIDELGQPIGEIKDLILDSAHQLNLVIHQADATAQQPSVLLNGRRIKKVSVQTQSVFVDITKADVRFLPEYFLPDDAITEIAEPPMMAQSMAEFGATENGNTPGEPTTAGAAVDAAAYTASLVEADFGTGAGDDRALGEALELALEEPETGLPTADDLMDFSQAEDLSLLEAAPDSGEIPELAADDWNLEELPNEARSLDEFGLDTMAPPDIDRLDLETAGALGDLEDLDLSATSLSAAPEMNLDDALPDLDLDVPLEAETTLDLGPDATAAEAVDFGFELGDESALGDLGDSAAAAELARSLEGAASDLSGLELGVEDLTAGFELEEPELNLDTAPEPNFAAALDLESPDAIAAEYSTDLAGLSNLELAATVSPDPDLGLSDLDLGAVAEAPMDTPTDGMDLGLDLSFDLDSPEPAEADTDLAWDEATDLSSPEAGFTLEEDLADFGFPEEAQGPPDDAIASEEFALGDLEFSAAEPGVEATEDLSDFGFPAEPDSAIAPTETSSTFDLSDLDFGGEADPETMPAANLDEDLSDFGFPAAADGDREPVVVAEEFALGDLEFPAAEPGVEATEDLSDFGFPAEPESELSAADEIDFGLGDLDTATSEPEPAIAMTEDLSDFGFPAEPESELSAADEIDFGLGNLDTGTSEPEPAIAMTEDLSDFGFSGEAEFGAGEERLDEPFLDELDFAAPETDAAFDMGEDVSEFDYPVDTARSPDEAEAEFEFGNLEVTPPETEPEAIASLAEINFAEPGADASIDGLSDLDFGADLSGAEASDSEFALESEESQAWAALEGDGTEEPSLGLEAVDESAEAGFDLDLPLVETDAIAPDEMGAAGSLDWDGLNEAESQPEPLLAATGLTDVADLNFALDEANPLDQMTLDTDFGAAELPEPEATAASPASESLGEFEFDRLDAIALTDDLEPEAPAEADAAGLLDLELTEPTPEPEATAEPPAADWNLDLPELADELPEGLSLGEPTEEPVDLAATEGWGDGLDLSLDLDTSLPEGTLIEPEPDMALGLTSGIETPPPLNLDDLELSPVADELPEGEVLTEAEAIAPVDFGEETFSAPAAMVMSDEPEGVLPTPTSTPEAAPETVDVIIPLLEERLNVEYQRRKVGEVIIRKRIETRMIEVPVRYEKLIIEQVSPEQKSLAEVDLSQGALENIEIVGVGGKPIVSGEFKSPRTATYVLDAIAKTLRHRCKSVRIEVELEDGKLQEAYQEWLDQCSQM